MEAYAYIKKAQIAKEKCIIITDSNGYVTNISSCKLINFYNS